jgi:uncharacterized tellurite resistance protein B-like protein
MFEKIKKILSVPLEKDPDRNKGNIAERIQVATAAILLEVANSDDEYSQKEQDRIMEILKNRFSLDQSSVLELMKLSEEERKGSIDLWYFTNLIDKHYNSEEKYRIIETVWQVIYADGKLDKYEDQLVHKLSNLLHVSHSQMIRAKMKHLPPD